MRAVLEAKYTAAPLPTHRIKTIDGDKYIMLDLKAQIGNKVITARKIGALAKGSVLKVINRGERGVKAENESGVSWPLDDTDYRVLRKMSVPKPLRVTAYGSGHCQMIRTAENAPTFNEIYDHTVIDLSNIESSQGHTLILKLPNNQHLAVCVMQHLEKTMIDLSPSGADKQQMLAFVGPGTERVSANLYCIEYQPPTS
jgi:hypothetical protein